MLFGDPDKFALVIEKVPEWSDDTFTNGLLYVFVNGEIFPKELRTATLSSILHMLMDSAFVNLTTDRRLYSLPDKELFAKLRALRYPDWFGDGGDKDEDYRFDIDLYELSDAGYDIFAVSDGNGVRVLIGYWEDSERFELVNSVEMMLDEFARVSGELSEYYRKEFIK